MQVCVCNRLATCVGHAHLCKHGMAVQSKGLASGLRISHSSTSLLLAINTALWTPMLTTTQI